MAITLEGRTFGQVSTATLDGSVFYGTFTLGNVSGRRRMAQARTIIALWSLDSVSVVVEVLDWGRFALGAVATLFGLTCIMFASNGAVEGFLRLAGNAALFVAALAVGYGSYLIYSSLPRTFLLITTNSVWLWLRVTGEGCAQRADAFADAVISAKLAENEGVMSSEDEPGGRGSAAMGNSQ